MQATEGYTPHVKNIPWAARPPRRGFMNKKITLLVKVTTSALIFSFVFAVAAPKASADQLRQQKSEINFLLRDRAASETGKQFLLPPVAVVVVRTAASVVEDGELQFTEFLTLNGLVLAASGLVGIKRFRQAKKVNGV